MITVDASVWAAAFDPRDRFHAASETFLRDHARRGTRLHAPAILLLETGCAIARRARSAAPGEAAAARLRSHPALELHPVDATLLNAARQLGTRFLLRSSDSLYVAVAELRGAPLVTWDEEVVRRAGARAPEGGIERKPTP